MPSYSPFRDQQPCFCILSQLLISLPLPSLYRNSTLPLHNYNNTTIYILACQNYPTSPADKQTYQQSNLPINNPHGLSGLRVYNTNQVNQIMYNQATYISTTSYPNANQNWATTTHNHSKNIPVYKSKYSTLGKTGTSGPDGIRETYCNAGWGFNPYIPPDL